VSLARLTALWTEKFDRSVVLDEHLDLRQLGSHFHFPNYPWGLHSKNRRVQLFVMHGMSIVSRFHTIPGSAEL
jgi:hypothetical protein